MQKPKLGVSCTKKADKAFMKKILSYPLTVLFYLVFGLLLAIFHPIQVICFRIFGYASHKRSVEILNFLILKSLHILGSRISFIGFEKLPNNKPLIIVSNHQSMWDIPPVVWGFRKQHAKFVSKKSLAKGIPSISYNLRHGGSVLIERKNRQQSINELIKLGKKIEEKNYSACIFPEGTRSKNGRLKKFKEGGILTLVKAAPSALIIPFVINGNYRLDRKGAFPLSIGNKLTYTVLDPIDPKEINIDELVPNVEKVIKEKLGQH